MTEDILTDIALTRHGISVLLDRLKVYLTDPVRSLDDRWKIYLEIEDLLPTHYYTPDLMDLYTDNPYDSFHMERHETKSFGDIDEQVMDNQPAENEIPDEWNKKYAIMYDKRDEWREAVLACGFGRFTFDW